MVSTASPLCYCNITKVRIRAPVLSDNAQAAIDKGSLRQDCSVPSKLICSQRAIENSAIRIL